MGTVTSLINKQKRHTANVNRVLREQSAFKVLFIVVFAALLEAGLWALFYEGFTFLNSIAGVGVIVIDRLFALFYMGMGSMLVLSSIITAYATFYRSDEVSFLLTRPFRISEIVLYKFFESTAFSSWAFGFIIIPFVGSYAWFHNMAISFALWTIVFALPFLLLCSGLGTLIVIVVARWGPRGRALKKTLLGLATTVILLLWWLSWDVYNPHAGAGAEFNISRLIPGLQLAANPLVPSWWISEGTMAIARGQLARGVMLFGMLSSTCMLLIMCIEWLGSAVFYESWQRVVASGEDRNRVALLFPRLDKMLNIFSHDIKSFIMKDIRTFFRDPMQWSQSFIFFGLLALYYMNLRSYNYQDIMRKEWLQVVGYLNVFGVSAVMCSLSARFIYPQLSLEGQGFWMLGLAPTSMKRILLTKYLFSLTLLIAISSVLMLLSSRMLDAAFIDRVIAVVLVTSVSCAICSFSMGLGAIFMDLKQKNPMAIVSGFGGTLNLVLSLCFILAAIFPFAVVSHFHSVLRLDQNAYHAGLRWSFVWLGILTGTATFVPLHLGIKALSRRDY